ncbi:MAG: hypothetical protein AAGA60_16445 [Cyanobacteria bacterium P01_E01_bin.42]
MESFDIPAHSQPSDRVPKPKEKIREPAPKCDRINVEMRNLT